MNKTPFYVLTSIGIIMSLLIIPLYTDASHQGTSTLQSKINDLDSDAVEDLPIPVLFGVSVQNLTKNYGEPRAGHSHIGLDIMAPEGTPIVSPTDAVVTSTGVWSGAGNYVSTAAPGGERFVYMHLSEIADLEDGDVLKVGDLIGYVGHTGNAIASAPHLHFEIHDSSDDTSDPYPRFTTAFTLKEKMTYLEEILDNHNNEAVLAALLATKFRAEFTAAQKEGIALPTDIQKVLGTTGSTTIVSPTAVVSSTGTLRVGSRGAQVVVLQKYLIKKAIGSASRVTADGAFGPITRQALVDFQKSTGILTPDGVYGPKSRAYIEANP